MARTSHNSNRKFRKLSFQHLEPRAMMTGNVAVVPLTGGDLRLTGDTLDNEIAIFQTITQGQVIPGSYLVNGLNGTTINGAPSRTFTGVTRDFLINLGVGNDRLIMGDNVATNNFTVPRDLNIDLGNGTNTLALNRITVRDDTSITTGTGRDELFIRGDFGRTPGVDGGANDLTINTGNGVDIVRIRNTMVRRNLSINTGAGPGADAGNDLVDMAIMSVGGDVSMLTGAGRDTVAIDQVSLNSDLRIDTGADRDFVTVRNAQIVDELIANLGTGDDEMQISDTSAGRGRLDGLTGIDRLFRTNVTFSQTPQILGFETNA